MEHTSGQVVQTEVFGQHNSDSLSLKIGKRIWNQMDRNVGRCYLMGVNMIKIHHIKFSKKYKVLSIKHVKKLNKIKMS